MKKTPNLEMFGALIGASAAMRRVYSRIQKAAEVDISVLIIGETGTGKELVAREIHQRSHRRNGPFVAANLGGSTPELIASELFGHEKGAFTGATYSKPGLFKEAENGTLFLDEITTMDSHTQISLLRVLEESVYRRVGGKKDLPTNIRLIAATNVNPSQAVRKGFFRKDLLYRFQVMRIMLPPLRKRKRDIELLARHYVDIYNREFENSVIGISRDALQCLRQYQWPGNVRELKNAIAQAVVMAEQGEIQPEHFPPRFLKGGKSEMPSMPEARTVSQEPIQEIEPQILSDSSLYPEIITTQADGVQVPFGMSLEEVDKIYILKTIAKCGNNKTRAAKILDISRKALYDKLKRWNLQN